jgi:hypothetical protein
MAINLEFNEHFSEFIVLNKKYFTLLYFIQ